MKKHIIVTAVMILFCAIALGIVCFLRTNGNADHIEEMQMSEENPSETETAGAGAAEKVTEFTENTQAAADIPQETEADDTEDDAGETKGDIVLMFAGDVLLRRAFVDEYKTQGIDCVLSRELQDEFVRADIAMVNQEFPFSARGTPMEDKQYTFRTDPSFVTALCDMGIDLVTLANNHSLDYGADALVDTFDTLDGAGVRYVGAGASKERAMELQVFEKKGKKIGFLAASRVIPVVEWNVENAVPGVFTTYDGTALCGEIKKAKEMCDFVAVYVHWGVERDEYPQEYQRVLGRQYIDAGADLVVGSHTHCLQGIEYYSGKPIFYGLGNFIFGSEIARTMAVKVTISGDDVTCRLIPAKTEDGRTVCMQDEQAAEVYQYMETISEGIEVNEDGIVQH